MLTSVTSSLASFELNSAMLLLIAKATLILVVALGITVTMQRTSAGARHLVWLVTLGTLLVVPALAAWSPLRLEILPPEKVASAAVVSPLSAQGSIATPGGVEPAPPATYTVSGSRSGVAEMLGGLNGVSLALTIWGVVAAAFVLWLAYGAFAVRRIVRNAHPLDTKDWLTPLYEIADRLQLDEPPRLLGSDSATMPFACGFTRPTIVLPTDCETWSTDRRAAVLLHELAHVKRRDLAGHTLGRVACALYWFHPLVWTAARQLRSESERACDDLALSCGARASDYAEHLLDIVTSVRHDSTPAVALAMARRKEFEGRMLAILDPELRHSQPNRRQSVGLVASLAAMAIVVGAAAPAPRAAEIVVKSSVPVATATPEISRDFTPRDVPETEQPSSVEQKRQQTQKQTDKEWQQVERRVESPAPKSEPKAEPRPNAVVSVDGIAARAIAELDERSDKIARVTSDERPALLANILRTEKDATLRRLAAWGLSEYAETLVAEEALVFAVRRDSDASVREMAAWALSDGRDNNATVNALIEASRSDANERVRAIAIWSLGHLGAREALPALTAALSDGNKGIRMRAIWAIGHMQPREAPPGLIAGLRDPQPAIRQITAWALYQIEDPAAIGPLNAALKAETNADLHIDYIRALAALGEKSVDAIRSLLLSSDPKIKQIAVRALAGGHGAGPWPWPWPEPRPHP